MAGPDLDQTIEEYHLALGKLVKGDAGPATAMYSHRDDVSLANPFGPVTVGWKSVTETAGLAAARYREGEVTGFEQVAKHVGRRFYYRPKLVRHEKRWRKPA